MTYRKCHLVMLEREIPTWMLLSTIDLLNVFQQCTH